jgi:hypothetical protein
MIAVCLAHGRGYASTATEYAVKAAFLYNFAKYIQWPRTSAALPNRPFTIGVIGKDPFGPPLDDAMRGQSVQRRAIVVRRFTRIEEVANCDVLFVSSSESGSLPRILQALGNAPVLTVGDMDQFAAHGGMINLVIEETRVVFEINVEAVKRAGLKPGSQLLRLARIVKQSEPEPTSK